MRRGDGGRTGTSCAVREPGGNLPADAVGVWEEAPLDAALEDANSDGQGGIGAHKAPGGVRCAKGLQG